VQGAESEGALRLRPRDLQGVGAQREVELGAGDRCARVVILKASIELEGVGPLQLPARAQVGEFVEVSNGSKTDPCAWLGRVSKIIGSPGYPTPEEKLRAEAIEGYERSHYPQGIARHFGAVLGSGNIYVGIGGAANVRIDYSSLAPVGEVFLQIRTLGTEMNYAGLRLNYTSGSGPVSVGANPFVLAAVPSQGFPGQNISLGYNWTINDPTVTAFNVSFQATSEHLSLDAVTLDVLPVGAVPEPSTWALGIFGLGAIAVAIRRRG
jgi:hypothetical protein